MSSFVPSVSSALKLMLELKNIRPPLKSESYVIIKKQWLVLVKEKDQMDRFDQNEPNCI